MTIRQASNDARIERQTGHVHLGYSFIQNAGFALSALFESPVLLKRKEAVGEFEVSTFLLGDAGIEELRFEVSANEHL